MPHQSFLRASLKDYTRCGCALSPAPLFTVPATPEYAPIEVGLTQKPLGYDRIHF
jgi:hypothetical protein